MSSAIADVAARAGVSKATASRALSGNGYVAEATRVRVIAAAREIGYVASPNAASLVTGQTKNIGVVMPFINRWFFGEVLEGIEQALLDRGYDMTLYNLHPGSADRQRVFEFFLARKRFDGIVVIGIEPTRVEVEQLVRLGVPLVGIGGPVNGIPSFTMDDTGAARRATEQLIGLGHRKIMHIAGEDADVLSDSVAGRRRAGYLDAMRAAGLEAESRTELAIMSLPGGYDAGAQALSDATNRPTAVFAACDEIAIGTMIAARRLGLRVPGDLSIVGVDGHEYAEMFSLTTVEQQPRQQGHDAVTALLNHIAGDPSPPAVVDVSARLVVRASTAALTAVAAAPLS
ncbi:LacI family DNA-binding transcriptional regulator [Mycetocola zhadangensis]|uniref:LacI family transcriptional regulator n=1 Tax=Mycetocola zhadangensis TaxID=1164595 RepID=A0A3L7IS26_9MICO|nr:LacI family DNA-binding transcriptional regulator [Mycetocola zhadangensis]RLQ80986.1 LacI family transcriptional regulator [Mycetocola zhadangensis]GGF03729.1 LacI family transcriptional regulator [Mycetocola zhadangensis]